MNSRCVENEMDQSEYMNNDFGMPACGCPCPPVYECPQERVCERFIMHEVPQE